MISFLIIKYEIITVLNYNCYYISLRWIKIEFNVQLSLGSSNSY